MRIPKPIKENATIGVIAPSCGVDSEKYLNDYLISKTQLEHLGFKIVESKKIDELVKAQSDTPKNRAKEFMKFYLDDSIDFLWAVSGGERMIEILPYIDFDLLKKSRAKWFVGFSDNTSMIQPLATKSNLASIHAMNMLECFSQQTEEASYDLLNLLLNEKTEFAQYDDEFVCTNKKHKINVEGRMMGGNLDIIMNLLGTEYDHIKQFMKKESKIIWYLEAFDYTVAGLKRCLWQLNQLGYFDSVQAILIGKMRYDEEVLGLSLEDVINDLNVKIPVIYQVQVGHVAPTMPFVNGGFAKVEVKDKKLKIRYDLTK